MYYQVEGSNVRLAGSLHVVPMDATIPPWVVSAYQWSEQIYLEHSPDDLHVHGFLPPGQSTKTRMPADLWATLNWSWPADQLPFARQKFWLIIMVLAFAGVPVMLGVENFIAQRARADSRSMRYLETLEEFAQIVDARISDYDYLTGLRSMLSTSIDTRSCNLSNLYAAWMTNKVDAIAKIVRSSPISQNPAAIRVLFEARNALWLPRIIALFGSQKRTVIFFGAGHLGARPGNGKLAGPEGAIER